jgi:RimJ/RimL family protein N-acetyltransferase
LILFERQLGEPIKWATPAVPVTVRFLKASEISDYMAFSPGVIAEEIRKRLEKGDKCFVARHDGTIAQVGWAATGTARIDYLDCEIKLADDEAYIYGSYTAPRFRNLNIPAVRGNQMVQHFRDLGYFRLISALMPENKPAFRPIEKIGYRRFGVMGYVKVGRWRHDFCRVVPGARSITLR